MNIRILRVHPGLMACSCAFFVLASCGAPQSGGGATEAVYSAPAMVDAASRGAGPSADSLTPFLKKDGSRFRIAVMQSGEYFSYADVLESIIQAFMTVGWIKERTFSYDGYPDGKTALNILKEMKARGQSDYLEFSPDLYFDLKWDDNNQKDPHFKKLASPAGGADLIISLGTQVSQILSKPQSFPIPVLVESVSDPVKSSILASENDSGKDYLTGVVDPEQDLRQVKLFHTVIGFKRLGLIYEDSEIGRTYAAYDDVMKVAKDENFTVVGDTHVLPDPENSDDDAAWARTEKAYVKALEELAPKVDAVYLAIQAGLSDNSLPQIVEILNRYKIPSFIMEGKDFVKNGVLLGESDSNLIAKGIYNVKKIIGIFHGAKPRSMNQVFEHVPHIAINLDTAATIGYDVPIDILASADEIYSTRAGGAGK